MSRGAPGEDEVEGKGRPTVGLGERHEEPEPHEDLIRRPAPARGGFIQLYEN